MGANCSGRSPKMSNVSEIAQVAHQKWATVSYLLKPLTNNEQPWANCSGRSPKMSEWVNRSFFSASEQFSHFSRVGNSLIWFPSKSLVFCQKMSEWAISWILESYFVCLFKQDGLCTKETAPSVSSISRVLRGSGHSIDGDMEGRPSHSIDGILGRVGPNMDTS